MDKRTKDISVKSLIKSLPFIGPTASKLAHLPLVMRARGLAFPGSAPFWERAYSKGSMLRVCPGSYGRLAEFKAEILNGFVRTNNIGSVIEFGCGDGSQLKLFRYPQYVGVDVAPCAIARCCSLFAPDPSKRFYRADALPDDIGQFDLALSLDVLYHLVEDRVFEAYMQRLFRSSRRYVGVYSSNHDALTQGHHVRHRNFTTWIEKSARDWRPDGFIANRFPFDPSRPEDTSHASFYFFKRQVG